MRALDAYLGPLSDQEIIEDINSKGTIRAWAEELFLELGFVTIPTSGSAHQEDGENPDQLEDYHGVVSYWLKTNRPVLMETFTAVGVELAKNWPANYEQIRFSLLQGAWFARTVQRRMHDAIRTSMGKASVTAWADRIWPTALKVIESGIFESHDGLGLPPYAIVEDLRKRLYIPRTIPAFDDRGEIAYDPKNGRPLNAHFVLLRELRQRVGELYTSVPA